MKSVYGIAMVVMLTACAAPSPQPRITPAHYASYTETDLPVERAFYRCRVESQKISAQYQAADDSYSGLEGAVNAAHYGSAAFSDCMAAEGYRYVGVRHATSSDRGTESSVVERLSVKVDDVTTANGVLVTQVLPGSGKDGGLRQGDIITMVDNQPVQSANQLAALIDGLSMGKPFVILIERNGRPLFLALKLQ